jgi:hypothetical protein
MKLIALHLPISILNEVSLPVYLKTHYGDHVLIRMFISFLDERDFFIEILFLE